MNRFPALDVPRKRELMQYLESLSKEINVPILYVTHQFGRIITLGRSRCADGKRQSESL